LSSQVLTTQPIELSAFARLMRAHSVLQRELADVLRPRGLTLNDFEALYHLSRAEENRLRRIDLAELLMLSPSGVTRLLDGLETTGLIENVNCDDDARVTWARLTTSGSETLQCVGVNHAESLRRLFRETLSDDEVAALTELLARIPGVDSGSCVG
jgi:DNA-binding MarR family transcriptional regulator